LVLFLPIKICFSFLFQTLDISEMDMDAMPGIKVEFPDPDNIMTFKAIVKPPSGLYQGAEFVFKIEVPPSYPYDPPKVTCETLVR
jgi:ubiquitin-conjugating enzyme E2 M